MGSLLDFVSASYKYSARLTANLQTSQYAVFGVSRQFSYFDLPG